MTEKNNRRCRLFIVLVLTIMSVLAPTAQAASRTAPPPPPGGAYTVRPNDTLWDIAARYDITVARLAAANPSVNPNALRPGQTLTIPTQTPDVPGSVHTVAPNDTLWAIASRYGLFVNDLLTANPGVDPRRLALGQSLRIPASPGKAAAPPAPAGATDVEISPEAQDLLNRINQTRLAGGRAALVWNDQLAAAAQAHADDCARRNRGSHVGSDGARLAARLERAGYNATWAGENWANARSVEQAMAMWWNEPPGADPHVQNIMTARAIEIGIGIAKGPWSYYLIADFGSR